MKFAALALTLLLAIGSQAASLQSDAPSELDHARAIFRDSLVKLDTKIREIVEQLQEGPYKGQMRMGSQKVHEMITQLLEMQQQASHVTDGVVQQVSEATSGIRQTLEAQIAEVNKAVEAHRDNIKGVITGHMEEYRTQLGPILREYAEKRAEEMKALQAKLAPIGEEIRSNIQETRNAIKPVGDAIRGAFDTLRDAYGPMFKLYIDEYAEQMKAAPTMLNEEKRSAIRAQAESLAEDVRTKLTAIFAIMQGEAAQ